MLPVHLDPKQYSIIQDTRGRHLAPPGRVAPPYPKRIPELANMIYAIRLKSLNLPSLELRRLRSDLLFCYKIMESMSIERASIERTSIERQQLIGSSIERPSIERPSIERAVN